MKHQVYRIIAILAIFCGLGVAGVQAQTPSKVEVNIPFEFSAGKTTLKAGVYSIKRLSGNVIMFRDSAGKPAVTLNAPVTLSSTGAEAGERLVFNKYGEQYSLAQIWLTVDSGRQVSTQKKTQQFERVEISLRVSKHVD